MDRLTGTDLINTPNEPAWAGMLREQAEQARAYHAGVPYPNWAFRDWKSEEHGPLPMPLPFPRHIVEKSARWLFGQPLQFTYNGNQTDADRLISDGIRSIWDSCNMESRIKSAALNASQAGGYVLFYRKAAEDAKCPVHIEIYDGAHQAIPFFDPLDARKMLMLRLQFPAYNPVEGAWYMHREEWTDAEQVTYDPLRIDSAESTSLNQMTAWHGYKRQDIQKSWVIRDVLPNEFGVIPGQYVMNLDIGAEHGWGDLWSLFRVVDRVNFTSHLAHLSNQLVAFPKEIRLNANLAADDDDEPLGINEPEYLYQKSDGAPVDVKLLESNPAGRNHVQQYLEDMIRALYEAAGSVRLSPEDVTGHGALSAQVLRLVHQPLIEQTKDKQVVQGANGIAPFLERMSLGLANAGIKHDAASADGEVQVYFADMFDLSEDEQMMRTQRLIAQVDARLISRERAVREIAASEGAADAAEWIDEAAEADESEDDSAQPSAPENNGREQNEQNRNDREEASS
jgi:hypothetical protein